MSEFDRRLSGRRLADILHGDTLQRIAARELGDATRWVDLANINDLLPPYITDDPATASPRVLLSGGVIVVPAAGEAGLYGEDSAPEALYGTDLALDDGALEAIDGDFALASGRDNLRQALVNRVVVERGEVMFHPRYGCLVRTLLGVVNGPTASLLAARYVEATLLADPRVKQVNGVTAVVEGDAIRVTADVLPVTGRSTKLEAII